MALKYNSSHSARMESFVPGIKSKEDRLGKLERGSFKGTFVCIASTKDETEGVVQWEIE